MAMDSPQTNDYQHYDAKGLREQLANTISRIDPEETPLLSNVGGGKVNGTLNEWQTDVLRSPQNVPEKVGFVASQRAITPSVRVGNYTQITADSFGIASTLEAVEKAGRTSERAYQLVKVGVEIKRDKEYIILQANQGGYAGAFDDAPKTATLHAWVKTNVSKASDGSNPSYTSGVPSTGRTDGTTRVASMAIINEVTKLCKDNGASPRLLFVSSAMKQKVSTFATSAIVTPQFQQSRNEQTAIIGAADVIVHDFGVLTVITDLWQRTRDIWFIDPKFLSVPNLRPYHEVPLAKRGDSDETMVVNEWMLKVTNEKGLGLAADLKLA